MAKDFSELANDEKIATAKAALEKNGITVLVAENGQEAKEKALAMIPEGSEVMNMTSATLDTLGISKEILESGKYNAVRNQFAKMNRETQGLQMQKLGAAPEFAVGSVHGVTEDGKVLIASATGSQLPAYAAGAKKVIWVVGAQKIVKNLDEAMERLQEYVFPLEDARAMKAYGSGSSINKILIINKEYLAGRITMVIVKEKLGF